MLGLFIIHIGRTESAIPTTEYPFLDTHYTSGIESEDLVFMQKNSLIAISELSIKRPTEPNRTTNWGDLDAILGCIARKESGMNPYAVGDHGLAFGYFQIHIDKHPVSYECAIDWDCSSAYTSKMISQGKGYLWTTYYSCL